MIEDSIYICVCRSRNTGEHWQINFKRERLTEAIWKAREWAANPDLAFDIVNAEIMIRRMKAQVGTKQ